jgi:hypothetical protein
LAVTLDQKSNKIHEDYVDFVGYKGFAKPAALPVIPSRARMEYRRCNSKDEFKYDPIQNREME